MKLRQAEKFSDGGRSEKIPVAEKRIAEHPGESVVAARDIYRSEVIRELEACLEREGKNELWQEYKKESGALSRAAMGVYRYLILCRSPQAFKASEIEAIVSGAAGKADGCRPEFRNLLEAAVTELTAANQAICRVLEKYSSVELFRTCFGDEPVGRVDLLASPIHVHFRCFNDEDYARAYVSDEKDDPIARKRAAEEAVTRSLACAPSWSSMPDLVGKIVIERVGENQMLGSNGELRIKNTILAKGNFIHEMLHKFSLLVPLWQMPKSEYDEVWQTLCPAIDLGEDYLVSHKESLIQDMIRVRRTEIGYDSLAAEEIISFYGEGYSLEEIYKEMTREGGNHDFFIDSYFSWEINEIYKWANEYWREAIGASGGSSEIEPIKNLEKVVEKVFRSDYYAMLREWINLIKDLEDSGLTRAQVASRLFTTPYTEWLGLREKLE